jgi:hypothetical protein
MHIFVVFGCFDRFNWGRLIRFVWPDQSLCVVMLCMHCAYNITHDVHYSCTLLNSEKTMINSVASFCEDAFKKKRL